MQTLCFGAADLGTDATDKFLVTGWVPTAPTVEIQLVVQQNLTITKFTVLQNTPGAPGNTVTYILRKNKTDTALVVPLTTDATMGTANGEVDLMPGDRISVKVTKSGTLTDGTLRASASINGF